MPIARERRELPDCPVHSGRRCHCTALLNADIKAGVWKIERVGKWEDVDYVPRCGSTLGVAAIRCEFPVGHSGWHANKFLLPDFEWEG